MLVTAFDVASARCIMRSRVGLVVSASWAEASADFTWPATSSSPTTMDSRPEATENKCWATDVPMVTRMDSTTLECSTPA